MRCGMMSAEAPVALKYKFLAEEALYTVDDQ
jgi:hypothetical protein